MELFLLSGVVLARATATRDLFRQEWRNRVFRRFLGSISVESRRGRDTRLILRCGQRFGLRVETRSNDRSNLFDRPGMIARSLCRT